MIETRTDPSNEVGPRWQPTQLVFRPYSPQKPGAANKSRTWRPLVARLTKHLLETYQICNVKFNYSDELNPIRYLTSPSIGVANDGYDNANFDLILSANYVLVNPDSQRRYIVRDILGHGAFGQVAKCCVEESKSFVAVKIIKNKPAYYQQALVEVSILKTLNNKYDPEDKHHVVRIHEFFVYRCHLCICFELLDANLYKIIKMNDLKGLSLNIVQLFSKQILRGLALLKDAGIIHCDLKPENILMCKNEKPAKIKIIDFGSACMENRTVYSYIQSRYYRSPEVLLGYQYTAAIDMWSFGCIVAELFIGLPLFPGVSEFDMLRRMMKILGGQPPDCVLKEAKNTSKFFKCIGNVPNVENGGVSMGGRSVYQAFSAEEYEARGLDKPAIRKEYFEHWNIETIVMNYPYREDLPVEDLIKERQMRLKLIDFLRGLIEFDPAKRWSPFQASKHPFVTGEHFAGPYKPPPETPCLPVAQNIKVDHHPGGGHWFVAGLSPNIQGQNRVALPQATQYSYAGSYGSLGSYGSYSDSAGFGSSSYGSYGDSGAVFSYHSPGGQAAVDIYAQGNAPILGSSPDARQRMIQFSHGNGLGVSPSAGNFAPLPLGTSPSQFTPRSSYSQVSVGSLGIYGPTSPARGSFHGSPLEMVAAGNQLNERKSWGYSGSSQLQESSSSSHWQGHIADGTSSSQAEWNSQIIGGSPSHLQSNSNATSWMQQQGGNGITVGGYFAINMPGSFGLGSNMQFSQTTGVTRNKPEASLSLLDPGDWDPNYSDEFLLQDDGLDMSCIATEFSNGLHLGSAGPLVGIGGFSPPAYDLQAGYLRSMSKPSHLMPHFTQNSPSRLKKQPVQQLNNWRSSSARGNDWNYTKEQRSPSGFNSGGLHSSGNSSFSDGMTWGRMTNHPVTSIPPTCSRS